MICHITFFNILLVSFSIYRQVRVENVILSKTTHKESQIKSPSFLCVVPFLERTGVLPPVAARTRVLQAADHIPE